MKPLLKSKEIARKSPAFHTEYYLLKEIEQNPDISQRELSRRLNIGLAVTNALIKKIVYKGWIRIQGLRPRRIAYFLTPMGFKEKSKLALNFLHRTLVFYNEAKEVLQRELDEIKKRGFRSFAVVGSGDIKEIFVIVAQKTDIPIKCIIDLELSQKTSFFEIPVFPGNFMLNPEKLTELNTNASSLNPANDMKDLAKIIKKIGAIIVLDERFPGLFNNKKTINWLQNNSTEIKQQKLDHESNELNFKSNKSKLKFEEIFSNKIIWEIFI